MSNGNVRLVFIDLRKVLGGGSLEKAAASLGVRQKYGLSKGFVPHAHLTGMEKLYGSEVPPYSSQCFDRMNSKKKICTEEEHEQLARQLRSGKRYIDLVRLYCKQDVDLCTLSFIEAMASYRELFGINILDASSFTSSSLFFRQASAVAPFLKGQPTFCALGDSLALRIVLAGLHGGVCMRMVSRMGVGDQLFPEEGSPTCKRIASFDFRSLYPSTMIHDPLPIGEFAVYNNAGNGLFRLSSSKSGIYSSQQYVAACLAHMSLKLEGHEIFSAHHAGTSGEINLIPRQWLDFVAFSSKGGRLYITILQHDSALHYSKPFDKEGKREVSHEPWCLRAGNACLEDSERYKESLRLAAWQKSVIEKIFGKHYSVRYSRISHCTFHNEYRFNGKTYPSPYEAAREGGRLMPELNYVELPFPPVLTLNMLMKSFREKRPSEPAFRAGFVVVSGSLPRREYNKRMGPVFTKKMLRKEDLTETFHADLRRRIRLEHPEADVERIAKRYISHLLTTPKLVPSNSLESATLTLSYFDFLLSLGLRVNKVEHVLLFGARSARSERKHAFREFIVGNSLHRERLTRKILHLESLEKTPETISELIRCRMQSSQLK